MISGFGMTSRSGRLLVAVVAALVLFGSLAGCALFYRGVSVPKYEARTFYETVSVSGGAISADETRVLYTSDETGVPNVYAKPIEGGEAVALTNSTTSSMFGIGWFPNDDRVLITADQEGNELNHLYVLDIDGTLRDLTPGENLKAQFAGWSEDERYFWVQTNERDPRYFDLYRYAVAHPNSDEYPREMVYRNADGATVSSISRNGRYLALVKQHNNMNSDVLLVDMTSPGARPKLLTEHEGNISYGVATFTPDSKKLYITSNEGSEFVRIWSHDLLTGKRELVLEADWDIQGVSFSRNGRYRVMMTNEDARTVVEMTDLELGVPVALPAVDGGEVLGVRVSKSGKRMTLSIGSDTSPTNLYSWDRESDEVRKLTESLNPEVEEWALVKSEVVRYASFDNLAIPAILWKPKVASKTRKVPAIVWVHGGPGGQSRTGYRADIQFLANHGYAILAVNNRGSSGYGKTFFHMDDKRHGDVDLKDCIYGKKYLESLDWVDRNRIAIMGGSYGGYMVVAALAFEPYAFHAGVDIFGVTNWLRTIENIPPWWESFRESLYSEMGDPATDRERLRAISPLFHADKIRRPLLVVQGANDPRVLKVESDEIVAAARENGVPVDYLVFPDEGHGFRKRENRIMAAERYLAFFEEHLTGVVNDE